MVKTILVACMATAALLASTAYAQSDTPGDGRATTSKPATKAEKDAARQKRMATSKEMAHGKGSVSSDNTVKTGKKATAEEKSAAKAKRKAAGAEAAKTGSAGGEAATSK